MPQHEIETCIFIRCSALTGLAGADRLQRLPAWNPFIRAISGPLREGLA